MLELRKIELQHERELIILRQKERELNLKEHQQNIQQREMDVQQQEISRKNHEKIMGLQKENQRINYEKSKLVKQF
ncbi:MAG: hypothetical protein M3512_07555 [Bacteroidota bacterium]|nr:hypothetical protein [Bacteroidota bacterium]